MSWSAVLVMMPLDAFSIGTRMWVKSPACSRAKASSTVGHSLSASLGNRRCAATWEKLPARPK
ncbi:MAG: hypothetical protein WDO13_16320 [Verrucomicrobiota bacterium]